MHTFCRAHQYSTASKLLHNGLRYTRDIFPHAMGQKSLYLHVCLFVCLFVCLYGLRPYLILSCLVLAGGFMQRLEKIVSIVVGL